MGVADDLDFGKGEESGMHKGLDRREDGPFVFEPRVSEGFADLVVIEIPAVQVGEDSVEMDLNETVRANLPHGKAAGFDPECAVFEEGADVAFGKDGKVIDRIAQRSSQGDEIFGWSGTGFGRGGMQGQCSRRDPP